jgi:hypothetical protein
MAGRTLEEGSLIGFLEQFVAQVQNGAKPMRIKN